MPESQIQANQQLHTFSEHREAIIRTARALVEDTKALVSGAASNQEQLAVSCQWYNYYYYSPNIIITT